MAEFQYFIDDGSGEDDDLVAHVEDENGKRRLEIKLAEYPGFIGEFGAMKHDQDIEGLKDYLIEKGIMGEDDTLLYAV